MVCKTAIGRGRPAGIGPRVCSLVVAAVDLSQATSWHFEHIKVAQKGTSGIYMLEQLSCPNNACQILILVDSSVTKASANAYALPSGFTLCN